MAGEPWVVLDTDVWSNLFARKARSDPLVLQWRAALEGKSVVIATQTRAEVLFGLAYKNLGPQRAGAIRRQLDTTPTVPVTEEVIQAYAELTANCMRAATGLHHKVHTGDRWVAATAIAIGAPLLAHDRIYQDAPGVQLL